MTEVTITMERYAALIAAERDAEVLKAIIEAAVSTYSGLSHSDLLVLNKVFNGKGESV